MLSDVAHNMYCEASLNQHEVLENITDVLLPVPCEAYVSTLVEGGHYHIVALPC